MSINGDLIARFDRRLLRHAAPALLVTVATLGAAAVSDAATTDNDRSSQSCFLLHAWDGQWKAAPDSRSIYVKENGVVFRIDLQQPIPLLQSTFATLDTKGSSDAICRPEDFQLVVSDRLGSKEGAIVRKITRLTSEEAAALPKKLRP